MLPHNYGGPETEKSWWGSHCSDTAAITKRFASFQLIQQGSEHFDLINYEHLQKNVWKLFSRKLALLTISRLQLFSSYVWHKKNISEQITLIHHREDRQAEFSHTLKDFIDHANVRWVLSSHHGQSSSTEKYWVNRAIRETHWPLFRRHYTGESDCWTMVPRARERTSVKKASSKTFSNDFFRDMHGKGSIGIL